MSRLRLGLALTNGAVDPGTLVATATHVERLGFHSIWTSEAYGADALVPLVWMAAHTERLRVGTRILQMHARTPAMTAMTAATLDQLSGGRFLLGLGVSGPQVAEGWHGQPYGAPLGRTREYLAIIRQVLGRGEPVEHHGDHYDVPYQGPGATGLGKPLRTSLHPRPDIPVYLAAIGPRNVRLATTVAQGVLPTLFSPHRWREACGDALDEIPDGFDVAPTVRVVVGDDVAWCRDQVRPALALYVGGMGARGSNFYNDLVSRYGFEAEAASIQELYLDGHRADAIAAVPDALVDEVALVGSRERIADQLAAWESSPATTLILDTDQQAALELLAELTQ